MEQILLTLAVALLGCLVATRLRLPAPAMIGSMLAVGFSNVFLDYAVLPWYAKVIAQSVSGAFIGMQISKKDVLNFRYLVRPFLLLVVMLTLNTFFTGVLVHLLTGFDYTTALLGSVAGGVSDISLLSIELGGDTQIVALMQTLRLVGVLLIFPYWIRFFTRREEDAQEDFRLITGNPAMGVTWLDRLVGGRRRKIVFTAVLCVVFGLLGNASPIPAGAMVLPMAVVILLNVTTSVCYVPVCFKTIAQLLAGAVVGCSMNSSIRALLTPRSLLAMAILMIDYWAVNVLYSLYCKRKGLLDLKSAMLASAPGGATDMSLIAADLNADLTKIALIQVLRAVYAVTFMPAVIVLFTGLIS